MGFSTASLQTTLLCNFDVFAAFFNLLDSLKSLTVLRGAGPLKSVSEDAINEIVVFFNDKVTQLDIDDDDKYSFAFFILRFYTFFKPFGVLSN
jgi:hypothetical protein